MQETIAVLFVGIGATVVTDLWAIARQRMLRTPLPNYGLVGRWLAHMPRGHFRHASIIAAQPVRGERLLGWAVHYFVGIAFAAILIGFAGAGWLRHPTLLPALLLGVGTVTAPFLLMQPGMGAGIAARLAPRPSAARLQSLITHGIFGLGLYAAGWLQLLLTGE
jgi:hypothetical protein